MALIMLVVSILAVGVCLVSLFGGRGRAAADKAAHDVEVRTAETRILIAQLKAPVRDADADLDRVLRDTVRLLRDRTRAR